MAIPGDLHGRGPGILTGARDHLIQMLERDKHVLDATTEDRFEALFTEVSVFGLRGGS